MEEKVRIQSQGVGSMGFMMLVAIEMLLVFLGNLHHANQQQIFLERFLPLAQNLFSHGTYALADGVPLFYPMWGYSILTIPGVAIGYPVQFLLVVQMALALIGIEKFYQLFDLRKKYWHIPLFIPFFAVMSVKWPDAIVTALIIILLALLKKYVDTKKSSVLVGFCILAAVLPIFRSEYSYLPLFLCVIFLLPTFRNSKPLILPLVIWFFAGILGLLPWGIRLLADTGSFRLSSTNDGGVLYISLGELPNNPWHLRYNDSTAYEYVHAHGTSDPYSIAGNDELEHAFKSDVQEYPFGYVKKVGYNIASAFWKGVYTGEYANLAMTKTERDSIDQRINSASGIGNKLRAVVALPLSEQLPIELEKLLQFCFMIGFLFLVLLALRNAIRVPRSDERRVILLIGAGIFLFKLLLVGLIQYEPRHMNPVYLLILGMALVGAKRREE